jgi:predicted Rossmann fold nucleotide-binding protein DprA/Smf involved in DNA uptake
VDKKTELWAIEHRGALLSGIGNQALLSAAPTAFFASRRCSGAAIRAGMEWALIQAREQHAVISGFHSPLEQSVLKILLEAQCPIIAVISRQITNARFDQAWITALAENRFTILSVNSQTQRITQASAARRNDVVAELASKIVIAQAEPAGALDLALIRWNEAGLETQVLANSR